MSASSSRQKPGLALLAAFLGWMFDGMEMGIFPIVAGPALREMGGAAGLTAGAGLDGYVKAWTGVVMAWFLLGAAAGGLVFGWFGDRIGRVRAMTWSILFYSAFTGLCYFAATPLQFTLLRFFAALGMGGEWALGVALVMESWPEARRPLLAGAIGAAANIGYAIIGTIGMIWNITDASWRWVMLVGAAPAGLTFFIRLFVPESEKWAASVQKRVVTPVREIFAPALRGRTLLAIAFASIALIVTWGIVQWIPLWVDQMMGGGDPKRKATIQLCSSLGAVGGSLAAPLVGGIIGRRPTYFLLCLASLGVCEWLFLGLHGYGGWFLFVTVLVGMFTASFYGWLPLYLPELFPTRARATGQGLAFNFGRVIAAAGVWQMPVLMSFFKTAHSAGYEKAGATIACIYVIGMVLIWFAPETKGRPLPE
jgi:MFS family permease